MPHILYLHNLPIMHSVPRPIVVHNTQLHKLLLNLLIHVPPRLSLSKVETRLLLDLTVHRVAGIVDRLTQKLHALALQALLLKIEGLRAAFVFFCKASFGEALRQVHVLVLLLRVVTLVLKFLQAIFSNQLLHFGIHIILACHKVVVVVHLRADEELFFQIRIRVLVLKLLRIRQRCFQQRRAFVLHGFLALGYVNRAGDHGLQILVAFFQIQHRAVLLFQ